MKLIYTILLLKIISVFGQFSTQVNWTFADLPTTTISQQRYKCSRKLDFSCECKTASTMYDVGAKNDVHPFCLTAEGKVHGACTGGCVDIHLRNFINTEIDGNLINIEAECINIRRTWIPPVYPKCLNENQEDVYNLNGGGTCDTKAKCQSYAQCKTAGTCADCQVGASWRPNGVPMGVTFIPGKCMMPDTAENSQKDVTTTYSNEADCLSNLTWIPPMNKVTKYYEIAHATEVGTGDAKTVTFSENDNRQCIAGESVQNRYGVDECPRNDPFCNQFPLIDKIDIDNDNYNQMILSASFTKYGKLRRCDSRGTYDETAKKWDNQLHPLAPCPDKRVPYYCDFPQNELFGTKENGTIVDTTCGVGVYKNSTRNAIGLPHGIREYENGYDMEGFQWTIEQEDSVSLATNMNEILTEMETVQMNIYSVGKLIDRNFLLDSHREGLDEYYVNKDNSMELNKFFEKIALTGDSLPFSELHTEDEIRAAADWSPTDLHSTGKTSSLRCHTVDDSTIKMFRGIKDVRKDFVDKFFESNKEPDCSFEEAILDNETNFNRCANDKQFDSFLYPSVRKAFINPIKADFFLSGFMKGQRFIKEFSQSKEEIGFIDAGQRKMVDGTEVDQNATFNHIKFMMSMTTDQVENCNTVTGSCRPTWFEYPQYRFSIDETDANTLLQNIIQSAQLQNVTSFEHCKTLCFDTANCGGFMFKAAAGLHQCKIINKAGQTLSNTPYTNLKKILLQDDIANDWTSVVLKRPDCEFQILNTRYVDVEVSEDGSRIFDRNSHDDDISGLWGYGETINKGRQWGYHTCRTSITVKKLEKIDADQVDLGLHNDIGEEFIKEYPYTITIKDEGCQNQVIEKEETVSQATSAAVSLTEAEEIVKIHAAATPTWCRSENGHYTGEVADSQNGGICLSHKQVPRYKFPSDSKPFGNTVEKDAKCMNGAVDTIALNPTRKECTAAGFVWSEARSYLHRGRAETCFVNGVYKLHEFETKEACEAETNGVWTPAVPATDALAFISSEDYALMENQCVTDATHTKASCEAIANTVWNDVIDKCYFPNILSELDCSETNNDRISVAVSWVHFYDSETVPLTYEDERLTCGALGYGAKHANGPYTSRYDRIRMVMFVDVLRLKDLYNEGKGASTIVPRGIPVGLTEGYTPITGFKDPLTDVKVVGQHLLKIEDQDVVYWNPTTKQKCTMKDAASPEITGCVTYSYATGYRASGRGETYRGETQQERDDRNQIRKVIGEYLVRDVGIDQASPTSLGKAFWNDDLTTISFLGTATSTDLPLEISVQDIREDFGDAKIYNRYMVELFSDCQDRTKKQQHSSRLHIQVFKEGRLHGERIRDSLPEISEGAYNAGFTKYNIAESTVNGEIELPDDIGQPLNTYDLVTLHDKDGQTCPQAGDYMLSNGGYEENTVTTYEIVTTEQTTHICKAGEEGASSRQLTLADCAAIADAANAPSFVFEHASQIDGDGKRGCQLCTGATGDNALTAISNQYLYVKNTIVTALGTYTYKATVVNYPTTPRAVGSALTGVTIDKTKCTIALKERSCDGFGYDVKTEDLLSKASPVHDTFQVTTKDICGPIEMHFDSAACGADPSLWADKGSCKDSNDAVKAEHTNRWDCETNGFIWEQACEYLRPCGHNTPPGFAKVCTTPSDSHCQICNWDTPTCYDTTRGNAHADGSIPSRLKSIDAKCAGFDFNNPHIKLGMNVKKVIDTLPDDITNLDFFDLPIEDQTYGNIYGAELVEFSVGFNILDTIFFEEDQYLQLEGMGNSRTEVIAFLKNNRISEIESVRDVRSMGDLTYPQLTTEEVIFTVQSYDPNYDPELHNVHIETLSICSHTPATFFEPYIALGKIERNVVNCIIGKVNNGRDAYGNILTEAKYQTGVDACQYVYETCPHKPMTGFSLKRDDENYFLLADYRPLYGQEGHLFIDDTCDMLSITRLLDLLTFPDFDNEYDNNMVYQFATNLPESCTNVDGVETCVNSGHLAVQQACVHEGTDTAVEALKPEDFFKKLGPNGNQVPVSQTIVRNFKSMMMKEAKDLERGVREVVPCRRLAVHGDDLSPQFADTILYGYNTGYGDLSKFGDRYEPRNCWFDSFITTCTNATGGDVTSTYDDGLKCRTPDEIPSYASTTTAPFICEAPAKGNSIGANVALSSLGDALIDRFDGGVSGEYTKDQCHQLCEDNQRDHCLWEESAAGLGSCYYVGGSTPDIVLDETDPYYVWECAARTDKVASSGSGMFALNTKSLTLTGTTEAEAKAACASAENCIGFEEVPVAPTAVKCTAADASAWSLTSTLDTNVVGASILSDVNECMFQCVGQIFTGTTDNPTHVEFIQDTSCTCKKAAGTCADSEANVHADHFAIDVTYTDVGGQPTNIVINRAKEFKFYEFIDTDSIDASSVKGKNSKYFVKPVEHQCFWCDWDNTQPKTYDDDSETCITNVLSHLENSESFEEYLDNIGPALDMEQEICVQKNNIYRAEGSKHIPCSYNNLYNFDLDSVYPPEQFELTDEEISYRLNPKAPSWDAIIFHPDDVGDIANHYEPITKNFILPIKAEVIIQGHACHDDYDFAAAPSRRRLLGNRRRQKIRRKLLQDDDAPAGQFAGTSNVAFNIEINIQSGTMSASDVPVSVNGKLVYPGDANYPQSRASAKVVSKEFVLAPLLNETNDEGCNQTCVKDCLHRENNILLTVVYGGYYFLILVLSVVPMFNVYKNVV